MSIYLGSIIHQALEKKPPIHRLILTKSNRYYFIDEDSRTLKGEYLAQVYATEIVEPELVFL